MLKQPTAPSQLLHLLEEDYQTAGFQTGWAGPTVEDPFQSLIVLFDNIGEEQRELSLELCFLPHMEDAEAAGIVILQAFITLVEGVPPDRYGDVLQLTAKLNTILPLGAYGLFQDTGVIYYKHNSLLLLSNDKLANVKAIDTENGIILHLQQLYMEAFMQTADGQTPIEDIINALLV